MRLETYCDLREAASRAAQARKECELEIFAALEAIDPELVIQSDFDLFDPDQFRTALERIAREHSLPTEDLDAVRVFLEAWAKKGSEDLD